MTGRHARMSTGRFAAVLLAAVLVAFMVMVTVITLATQ